MVNVSPVVALHGGHNKASVNTLEMIPEDNSLQVNRGRQGVLHRPSNGYYLVEFGQRNPGLRKWGGPNLCAYT